MDKLHPYIGAPNYQFWKNEPAIVDPALFDPIKSTSFKIDLESAVVTAGSCFAQHVARHLAASGFRFLVTEQAHPLILADVAAQNNYGIFSARYGNIYTSLQMKQLLERAYGLFEPIESSWKRRDAVYVDPFRPQIQEGGFISEADLFLDRERHLSAVRKAVEMMDVFVFTLGLTECWVDSRDGAVFPLAPGVAGGMFDRDIFKFVNLGVNEIVDQMSWVIDFIRSRNSKVKFILTVSPVPLNATALDQHVFVATTYSKAVLRVAADQLCQRYELCDYFPSYEIITSPYAKGSYYAADCRNIAEAGVSHVMSLFLKHYGDVVLAPQETSPRPVEESESSRYISDMQKVVEVLCDEERISNEVAV